MKERPILFSAPMVRAILNGSKSQTRRVVKPERNPSIGCWMTPGEIALDSSTVQEHISPYGKAGDHLWVRETWAPDRGVAWYRADMCQATLNACPPSFRWKPSIHMPRWASRITLEVTGVRVERLQDISIEDCQSEGAWGPDESIVEKVAQHFGIDFLAANPYLAYRMLWESINGPGSWEANPWVWVVEFKRINGGEK